MEFLSENTGLAQAFNEDAMAAEAGNIGYFDWGLDEQNKALRDKEFAKELKVQRALAEQFQEIFKDDMGITDLEAMGKHLPFAFSDLRQISVVNLWALRDRYRTEFVRSEARVMSGLELLDEAKRIKAYTDSVQAWDAEIRRYAVRDFADLLMDLARPGGSLRGDNETSAALLFSEVRDATEISESERLQVYDVIRGVIGEVAYQNAQTNAVSISENHATKRARDSAEQQAKVGLVPVHTFLSEATKFLLDQEFAKIEQAGWAEYVVDMEILYDAMNTMTKAHADLLDHDSIADSRDASEQAYTNLERRAGQLGLVSEQHEQVLGYILSKSWQHLDSQGL